VYWREICRDGYRLCGARPRLSEVGATTWPHSNLGGIRRGTRQSNFPSLVVRPWRARGRCRQTGRNEGSMEAAQGRTRLEYWRAPRSHPGDDWSCRRRFGWVVADLHKTLATWHAAEPAGTHPTMLDYRGREKRRCNLAEVDRRHSHTGIAPPETSPEWSASPGAPSLLRGRSSRVVHLWVGRLPTAGYKSSPHKYLSFSKKLENFWKYFYLFEIVCI
jgi:hypothetical protein